MHLNRRQVIKNREIQCGGCQDHGRREGKIDGEDHLQGGEATKKLARCNKLWKMKSNEARKRAVREEEEDKGTKRMRDEDGEDQEEHLDEDCGREASTEEMKYRDHQYRENPNMQMKGEDIELVIDSDHCGPELQIW